MVGGFAAATELWELASWMVDEALLYHAAAMAKGGYWSGSYSNFFLDLAARSTAFKEAFQKVERSELARELCGWSSNSKPWDFSVTTIKPSSPFIYFLSLEVARVVSPRASLRLIED